MPLMEKLKKIAGIHVIREARNKLKIILRYFLLAIKIFDVS